MTENLIKWLKYDEKTIIKKSKNYENITKKIK